MTINRKHANNPEKVSQSIAEFCKIRWSRKPWNWCTLFFRFDFLRSFNDSINPVIEFMNFYTQKLVSKIQYSTGFC